MGYIVMKFLLTILSIFIFLPTLLFSLIIFIGFLIYKKWQKAFQIAADMSTLFFILSVYFIIITVWDRSLFFILMISMVLLVILFGFIYWKLKQQIHYERILRGFWRLMFLIFVLLHVSLMFYGMISNAYSFLKT